MSRPLHLRAPRAERNRAPLWVWPALSAVVASGAALALLRIGPGQGSAPVVLDWPGGRDSAIAVLQTIAASVITVTSLTFTLTVVSLQLASQQFSPRLLREFTRDPVTKVVLSVLVGTFVFTLTVLRGLQPAKSFPSVAVLGAFLLGFIALLRFSRSSRTSPGCCTSTR